MKHNGNQSVCFYGTAKTQMYENLEDITTKGSTYC